MRLGEQNNLPKDKELVSAKYQNWNWDMGWYYKSTVLCSYISLFFGFPGNQLILPLPTTFYSSGPQRPMSEPVPLCLPKSVLLSSTMNAATTLAILKPCWNPLHLLKVKSSYYSYALPGDRFWTAFWGVELLRKTFFCVNPGTVGEGKAHLHLRTWSLNPHSSIIVLPLQHKTLRPTSQGSEN